MQWFLYEKAINYLVKYWPEERQKKPALFHSTRVWAFLWYLGYDEYVQIAWLLHDSLEDTNISEQLIKDEFWEEVLFIVKANTKNKNLKKEDILEDMVYRCYLRWKNALVVKSVNVYDNFIFYKKQNNIKELERCKFLSELILDYKSTLEDNRIISLLEEIIKNKI